MLMKFADDTKLEGVTNNEDGDLIQVDIEKLEKMVTKKPRRTYKNIF